MAEGPLRVVSNTQLAEQELAEQVAADEQRAALEVDKTTANAGVAKHVRTEFERYRRERSCQNLTKRYLDNLRAYNGQYSEEKLADIKKFGGSSVFARITTSKCRGATALLRDVYLGGERPWSMQATPVPNVPQNIEQDIEQLVAVEAASAASLGQPADEGAMRNRVSALYKSAQRAAKKQADEDAKSSAVRIEDILVEGGFYAALKEFLTDLPIFPFACIKGPEVKNVLEVTWKEGKLVQATRAKMFWRRVSPFDLFFSPEASNADNAQVIERISLRRNDLNMLLGIPGYNDEAIRAVLTEYEHGYTEVLEEGDAERADQESRENPAMGRGDLYDTLEYHGYMRGQWLLDYGFTDEQVTDPIMDYSVVCWVVGQHAIKVHINPNPKQGHNYYTTSFEKIPGSIYGNALPEVMGDLQDVANATLRSLVNNMSISSGPQVMINEDRLSPTCNGDNLHPWKRWRFTSDPYGDNNVAPISFFQPQSNAQELLHVYKSMTDIADEVSAIPRYITGGEKVGGAASTASGLSMLMNNVAKVLQNVAASIDEEVLNRSLSDLYTMLLLTEPAPYFNGDAQVQVRGVAVAIQKETERMRKLEMLNLTMNPIDIEIIGKEGRAALLRDVAEELGMPGDQIIPDSDTMEARAQAQQQAPPQAQAQQAAQGQGSQPQAPHNNTSGRPTEEFDNQHLTNT